MLPPARYDGRMDEFLLMLEDDSDRLARFGPVIARARPGLKFMHWHNAHTMIRECPPYLHSCRLISLDHDLDPEPGMGDPGDGLLMAKFLAPLRPTCPILIHTSNGDGARRMVGEFELEGIAARTILPLGADWIERFWRAKMEESLTA